jgi:hypothetical protein
MANFAPTEGHSAKRHNERIENGQLLQPMRYSAKGNDEMRMKMANLLQPIRGTRQKGLLAGSPREGNTNKKILDSLFDSVVSLFGLKSNSRPMKYK